MVPVREVLWVAFDHHEECQYDRSSANGAVCVLHVKRRVRRAGLEIAVELSGDRDRRAAQRG